MKHILKLTFKVIKKLQSRHDKLETDDTVQFLVMTHSFPQHTDLFQLENTKIDFENTCKALDTIQKGSFSGPKSEGLNHFKMHIDGERAFCLQQ